MRKYLAESGTDDEKKIADDCDLGTLIELAKRRLSFKKRGAKIKTLFDVLFDFSPWPSKEAHQTILDLALLRNIFVHVGTPVPGEYAKHACRPGLFSETTYGDLPTIYRVQHSQVLLLVRDTILAMKTQSDNLRRELSKRDEWLERQPPTLS
jgi:hypothetical protein